MDLLLAARVGFGRLFVGHFQPVGRGDGVEAGSGLDARATWWSLWRLVSNAHAMASTEPGRVDPERLSRTRPMCFENNGLRSNRAESERGGGGDRGQGRGWK
jgi:hypothetical protein